MKTFAQMMSLLSLFSQHLFLLLFFVVKEKSPKNSFDLLPVRGWQCSNLITFNPKFGWCELNPVPESAAQAFSRLKLIPANSATAQGQWVAPPAQQRPLSPLLTGSQNRDSLASYLGISLYLGQPLTEELPVDICIGHNTFHNTTQWPAQTFCN